MPKGIKCPKDIISKGTKCPKEQNAQRNNLEYSRLKFWPLSLVRCLCIILTWEDSNLTCFEVFCLFLIGAFTSNTALRNCFFFVLGNYFWKYLSDKSFSFGIVLKMGSIFKPDLPAKNEQWYSPKWRYFISNLYIHLYMIWPFIYVGIC